MIDLVEAEQIATGLLRGTIQAEGFKDFAACATNVQDIANDAKTAVQDFKKGGASNIMSGLESMADMLLWARNAGVVCNPKTSADWAKIEAMAAELKNPKTFIYKIGKDLILNGEEITDELELAVEDYEKNNWEQFGFDLGVAASKTLLGSTYPVTTLNLL